MVAVLLSGPAGEPVTRDEAKAHARIDGTDEDARVDALIAAARADVENRTGRALMTQSWRIVKDCVPRGGIVRLNPSPVISVDQVTVYGPDGAAEIVSPSEYLVDLVSSPGRLKLGLGRFWGTRAMNGLEVDVTVGYGATAELVPAPLKHAMQMLVAYWFEQREAGAIAAVAGPVAHSVAALCAPYRLPRLA
ncbi:MAG: head-tail connector protein [Pseudomonadota bacterium]